MTSVLFVLTVSVNALYSKVICLPSHTYLRILSRDTLKATHIRAVKALGRLGDKRAIAPLLKEKAAEKAQALLVTKPYFTHEDPSIYELLIENIQAALARLQAEP